MPAQVEGGVAAYGASLVGMPVLAVAFGKKGGWAHTVNSQTAYSVYRLTVRQPCPFPLPSLPYLRYVLFALMACAWARLSFHLSSLSLSPNCCRSPDLI